MPWLSIVIIIPVFLLLGGIGYLLMRNAVRVWVDHRVKQGLLEKFEHNPELLDSFDDLQEYLDSWEELAQSPPLVDPLLMGVLLSSFGLVISLLTWAFGHGQWATSSYIGGLITVVIGFMLTLVGLSIRYLLRPPSEAVLKERMREYLRRARGGGELP